MNSANSHPISPAIPHAGHAPAALPPHAPAQSMVTPAGNGAGASRAAQAAQLQRMNQAPRTLAPHVRREFKRVVGGVEIPVKRTIINAEAARIQRGLKTLMREMELSSPMAPGHHAHRPLGRQSLGTAGPGKPESTFPATQLTQLDLFEESNREARSRADRILDERLTRYARLTTSQAAHLAMARVRYAVAKVAVDAGAGTVASLAEMAADMVRLDELLFTESLARLAPEDVAAVRDACTERYSERFALQAAPALDQIEYPIDSNDEELGEAQASACEQHREVMRG